jgi:pSer/pThr/pTyr-binding forkhead associated (FHA) protein
MAESQGVVLTRLSPRPAHRPRARCRKSPPTATSRCGQWPLEGVATGIGRRDDNDVVLDDPKVSRYHATIIDTGTGFVINDLRSANGIEVAHSRIRGCATLSDGDVIKIAGHHLTFELALVEPRQH